VAEKKSAWEGMGGGGSGDDEFVAAADDGLVAVADVTATGGLVASTGWGIKLR
jgi:hypothetical protein